MFNVNTWEERVELTVMNVLRMGNPCIVFREEVRTTYDIIRACMHK